MVFVERLGVERFLFYYPMFTKAKRIELRKQIVASMLEDHFDRTARAFY